MAGETLLNPRRLILASASPRRRQLMAEAGFEFDVVHAEFDESAFISGGRAPDELARELSFLKARDVAARRAEGIVLGADTIVASGGAVFGKPVDADDARRILRVLTAAPHDVITGVTLLDAASGRRESFSDTTRVTMAAMTVRDLEAYIASGLWAGKAGAYGIQDHDDAFVRRLDGSFSNVVGLPMERVTSALAGWGIWPRPH